MKVWHLIWYLLHLLRHRKKNTPLAAAPPQSEAPTFMVHRWEIWYVYTCYLSEDIPDLREAGEKLLRAKFARAVITPSGEIGFRQEDRIEWGRLAEKDIKDASFTTVIKFPEKLPQDLREPIVKMTAMRSAARHLFSFQAPLNDESISIVCPNLVVFPTRDHGVPLEVSARLHKSGIVSFSFRSNLQLPQGISLDSFIADYVNISYQFVENDVAVTFLCIDAFMRDKHPSSIWHRTRESSVRRFIHNDLLDKSKREAEDRGRSLSENRILVKVDEDSDLSNVTLEYVRAMAYALGSPRKGIPYVFLGEPKEPRWTGFYTGSPHIHLLEFSNQSESAEENQRRHGEAFKWILARTPPAGRKPLRGELPQNTRPFDDYAVYVNEAAVLWAYTAGQNNASGKGSVDRPFYRPTQHHQVKGELLEYGRILHKSLSHELEQEDLDWKRLFSVRKRQVQFDLDLQETGQFGEIREFLEVGLRARKLDELRKRNSGSLEFRESMASVRESRKLANTGMALTLVLGLLGLPDAIDFLNTYVVPHVSWLSKLAKESLIRTGILAGVTVVTVLVVTIGVIFVFGRLRWVTWTARIKRD